MATPLDGLAPRWHSGQTLGVEAVCMEQRDGTWRVVARSDRLRAVLGAQPLLLEAAVGLALVRCMKANALEVQITR